MRTATAALICLLTPAAVVAPWTVRNRLALGEWLTVATGGGIQYWKGEGVYTHAFNIECGVYQQVTGTPHTLIHYGPRLPAHDRQFADTALKHITLRPAHFAGRTAAGLFVFWAHDDQGVFKQIFTGLCNLPLVGLFLWQLWRHRRRVPVWVWGVSALVFAIHFAIALFYGNASYFLTVLPLVMVGAVWGWRTNGEKISAFVFSFTMNWLKKWQIGSLLSYKHGNTYQGFYCGNRSRSLNELCDLASIPNYNRQKRIRMDKA